MLHSVVSATFTSSSNLALPLQTVLFELAIIRMLQQSDTSKAVYMAPTKSLCTQKASEWKEKLQAFPCSVVELTVRREQREQKDVLTVITDFYCTYTRIPGRLRLCWCRSCQGRQGHRDDACECIESGAIAEQD